MGDGTTCTAAKEGGVKERMSEVTTQGRSEEVFLHTTLRMKEDNLQLS